VAAWSPLDGGVLSGKFTGPQGSEPGTRIDPASITAQLGLPREIVARLDAAAGIDLGFPATFIQDNTPWVFGAAALPAGG
jgi:hypothetical protein